MPSTVDVIIPTYKNRYWLRRCLRSISRAGCKEIGSIIVIDNGGDVEPDSAVTLLSPGSNIGWAAGINAGAKVAASDFIIALNDDTEFECSSDTVFNMLSHFADPSVGAVGPGTGSGSGPQASPGNEVEETKCLVGFCIMFRRDEFISMGGLDESLVMGDDVDISIRMARAGRRLVIDRRSFVYHHAFKTGVRLYGKATDAGGWNSREMVTESMLAVLDKHGKEAYLGAINWREPIPVRS